MPKSQIVDISRFASADLHQQICISRFASAEKLVSYAGLAPSHRDADVHRGGGITKRGSAWLRNAMVEAANTIVRFDERMGSFYFRIAKRGKQRWQLQDRMLATIRVHTNSESVSYTKS